jgi:heme oxygenase
MAIPTPEPGERTLRCATRATMGSPVPANSDIRARLRKSTAAVHERLHQHHGFAAAAAGTIDLVDYQRLLARLWGFHHAFEKALGQVDRERDVGVEFTSRGRSRMLESDLMALGWDGAAVVRLPQCQSLRAPANSAEFMGALYVVEGSTLGGIQLARALEPLVGSGEGRSFFLGYGDRHGAMWRAFLNRLEDCASSEAAADAVIEGAIGAFADFESWMAGWRVEQRT